MASRQQHGLDLDGSRMWFLENHEDCLDSWETDLDAWLRNRRSLGRILKQIPRRKESFKRSCERWSRRSSGFRYVPSDLAFVALKSDSDSLNPVPTVRLAVFRYRAYITRAPSRSTRSGR